jgi:hypothetical protein
VTGLGVPAGTPPAERGAMRLFDSLWEPLAVTILGLVLLVASFCR